MSLLVRYCTSTTAHFHACTDASNRPRGRSWPAHPAQVGQVEELLYQLQMRGQGGGDAAVPVPPITSSKSPLISPRNGSAAPSKPGAAANAGRAAAPSKPTTPPMGAAKGVAPPAPAAVQAAAPGKRAPPAATPAPAPMLNGKPVPKTSSRMEAGGAGEVGRNGNTLCGAGRRRCRVGVVLQVPHIRKQQGPI